MLFAEKTRAVLSAHMTPDDLPFVLMFFSTVVICLLTLAAIRRPVEDGGTSSYPLPARTAPEPKPPSEKTGIWRLLTKTDYSPFGAVRSSSNGHVGRQVWRFYPASETAGETRSERASRALHDQALALARAEYAREAQTKHHSGDVPYRLQCKREKEAPPAPRRRSLSFGRAAPTEEETVTTALRSGIGFYGTLQMEDGHWPGDYGGPMFLLPGLVIALYVAEVALPEEHRYEMLRYLKNHQNPDGGIGLHIEGHSTMFGTSLNYVAARLLGLPADDPWAVACRKFMHARGGAVNNTSWAKFWLALLGVYEWRGLNPLPPEMWLLPYSLLVHPGRFWCHCRMVYLPMSYLFGRRAACPLTPTTAALREELYPVPYAEVQWHTHRNNCGAEDLYTTHHWTQDALWTLLYYLEPLTPSWLRRRALARTLEIIRHEDASSRFVDIGPVNKAINLVCEFYADPSGERLAAHLPRVLDYLWLAEDGMKMQGYNGSQLWDTAFAAQALCATRLAAEFPAIVGAAHAYVDASQVREDTDQRERMYRHISNGAWPFSTQDHGWPISDCSSEGLKAALCMQALPKGAVPGLQPLEPQRLFDCVNLILSYQNTKQHWGGLRGQALAEAVRGGEGGWATYENTRGPALLELLNPSECFGDIVIDYSYVELTSACVRALSAFAKVHPEHRAAEVAEATRLGAKYMKRIQRADGSWYGSWGVCFTYAAWFGVAGLAEMGERDGTSDAVTRALAFLYAKQRDDGGWGESYLSSSMKEYHHADESQVVNTAWAMMAILDGTQGVADSEAKARPLLAKAAAFLVRSQEASGDWPQQLISGVFNHNCMITYANYRNIFPLWALGEYRARYLGA